jgi:hypothetical protein
MKNCNLLFRQSWIQIIGTLKSRTSKELCSMINIIIILISNNYRKLLILKIFIVLNQQIILINLIIKNEKEFIYILKYKS